MRRIAVVGSGIAGLAVAFRLAGESCLTLFEAAGRFGGHTHTVDVEIATAAGRLRHGVDTGFLVFNERTYPQLIALFDELGVPTVHSEMSFSVQATDADIEWSGSNLDSVFAQRRNLLRPRFLGMLREIDRFNRLCSGLAVQHGGAEMPGGDLPIGDFLDSHRFGSAFRDWYFLPMMACIWSCPTEQMLQFPVATMIRFCHNHGLIQITGRPRWFTVAGGARQYVAKMLRAVPDARLATPVQRITRLADGGVLVATAAGSERFDEVVLACHSDQALALLAEPTRAEREILGAIRYQPNRAVLHTDVDLLPRRRRAWAAWNYERGATLAAAVPAPVCLHYLINRLQPLPFETPVIVSLNPLREPRAQTVQGDFQYAHPVFDRGAIAAQRRLAELQGHGGVWFCGAWTRYGFHEDGLMSGLAVVDALRARRVEPLKAAA